MAAQFQTRVAKLAQQEKASQCDFVSGAIEALEGEVALLKGQNRLQADEVRALRQTIVELESVNSKLRAQTAVTITDLRNEIKALRASPQIEVEDLEESF